MRLKTLALWIAMIFSVICAAVGQAQSPDSVALATQIFGRLTSTSIYPDDPRFAKLVAAVEQGDLMVAAQIASSDENFYRVTVKNWAAPWSSQDGSLANELDDMQATAIGLVRDREDFRYFLTGDFRYQAHPDIGMPVHREDDNRHYSELENSYLSLRDSLVRTERSSRTDFGNVGVFASRGFAKAYYDGGTNRRAVSFSFEHFLCKPISIWREASLPDDYVRRDVSRWPTGNVNEYHTECRGCHAPMDALSGAFSHYDYINSEIAFDPNRVASKYNINSNIFPAGYKADDARWENYLIKNQDHHFGWTGTSRGRSLAEFSAMLSRSKAFARCMTKKAIESVCFRGAPAGFVEKLADQLKVRNYDMRSIFEMAAIDPQCNAN